ncbi:hypothetical protein [Paraburkholderia dinghuensis]|uniref:Alpha/beta hydrolase n=1 Tax=Paraburkholderia dinghuensis TaxID=2305225 RepID=A0A3N6N0M0_9BURK|nr:hypothetical protein [Paraburkholderia dinghuensis]RQH09609.1 hypothetical protein D1Y85_00110 [Paraburkholderia dinghuensis]
MAAMFIAAHAYAAPLDHGDLVTLSTRSGVTQGIFIESPIENPPFAVALYSGSSGAIKLDSTGATAYQGNFLIRTAHYWIDKGYAVALVDMPSDHADGGDDQYRLSGDSLADQRAVVAELRKRFPRALVVLTGTSRGTVTVGSVLANDAGLADLYVLTSPVTIASRSQPGISVLSFGNADPKKVLVVSNRNDRCPVALFSGGEQLARRYGMTFVAEDSSDGTDNCGGRSPHGFFGIEKRVLDDIDGWMTAQRPAAAQQ